MKQVWSLHWVAQRLHLQCQKARWLLLFSGQLMEIWPIIPWWEITLRSLTLLCRDSNLWPKNGKAPNANQQQSNQMVCPWLVVYLTWNFRIWQLNWWFGQCPTPITKPQSKCSSPNFGHTVNGLVGVRWTTNLSNFWLLMFWYPLCFDWFCFCSTVPLTLFCFWILNRTKGKEWSNSQTLGCSQTQVVML